MVLGGSRAVVGPAETSSTETRKLNRWRDSRCGGRGSESIAHFSPTPLDPGHSTNPYRYY